jgi:hypothetical protein
LAFRRALKNISGIDFFWNEKSKKSIPEIFLNGLYGMPRL